MDFSILLSPGSLLYVGIGAAILLIIIFTAFLFKEKSSEATESTIAVSSNVSVAVGTQAVTQSTEALPSTEVVNQTPVIEPVATLPVSEASKTEVPPLSSWKPSQEAAPIPVKDDVADAGISVSESSSEKLP